ALQAGRSGNIDGAWGSSAALAVAALGVRAPRVMLVAIAFPRDLDAWADDLTTFNGPRPAIFPALDNFAPQSVLLDEVAGQRLRILKQLESDDPPGFVLATIQALLQPVPDRARLALGRRTLRVGEQLDIDGLAGWLVDRGYKRCDAVELPGEFSPRRGGICDIFSRHGEAPVRLEFFGDEIESIRHFAPHTQRSLGNLDAAELIGSQTANDGRIALTGHPIDYLPAGSWTVLAEPDDL